MAGSEALGIKRLENIVFYVNDLDRSHAFYRDRVDFALVAEAGSEMVRRTGERWRVYEAGDARIDVIAPSRGDARSARFLKRHPDGIAALVFEVADIDATYRVLDERGATIVDAVRTETCDGGGEVRHFQIATPFGEALFRFVQRVDYTGAWPGLDVIDNGPSNRFGFTHIDHITSNFLTLKPMELWCKQVLGLEQYWNIAFHTDDVAPDGDHGSGLKSVVLWDPHSGVKFANNEPLRPHFEASQIYLFVMDNMGPGIQHAALATGDIIRTVTDLRSRDVAFMYTPGTYYDMLPERIISSGIGAIDEEIALLRELGVLIDGKAAGDYLLQIFLQDAAGLYADDKAGPFFFEIIQRKGDQGFGGGNFRALFESIELEQKKQHRV